MPSRTEVGRSLTRASAERRRNGVRAARVLVKQTPPRAPRANARTRSIRRKASWFVSGVPFTGCVRVGLAPQVKTPHAPRGGDGELPDGFGAGRAVLARRHEDVRGRACRRRRLFQLSPKGSRRGGSHPAVTRGRDPSHRDAGMAGEMSTEASACEKLRSDLEIGSKQRELRGLRAPPTDPSMPATTLPVCASPDGPILSERTSDGRPLGAPSRRTQRETDK